MVFISCFERTDFNEFQGTKVLGSRVNEASDSNESGNDKAVKVISVTKRRN
jgi:hypothetical protein